MEQYMRRGRCPSLYRDTARSQGDTVFTAYDAPSGISRIFCTRINFYGFVSLSDHWLKSGGWMTLTFRMY